MKEVPIKKYIRYLFVLAILVFMLNKLYLRPWILERELPELFNLIVLSIPNLIEAFVGTLLLTGILYQVRQYFNKRLGGYKDMHIQLVAVSIAGIYSISQEFKFHNLGGNNVYDIYDVVASVLGFILAFGIIRKYGFLDDEDT